MVPADDTMPGPSGLAARSTLRADSAVYVWSPPVAAAAPAPAVVSSTPPRQQEPPGLFVGGGAQGHGVYLPQSPVGNIAAFNGGPYHNRGQHYHDVHDEVRMAQACARSQRPRTKYTTCAGVAQPATCTHDAPARGLRTAAGPARCRAPPRT